MNVKRIRFQRQLVDCRRRNDFRVLVLRFAID